MIHGNVSNVNRQRCACCLRWLDPKKEQVFNDADDTHSLCRRCLLTAEQNAERIKANIPLCPKPNVSKAPTIGEIRQMLQGAKLPSHVGASLFLIDAVRLGIPASVVNAVLRGGAA